MLKTQGNISESIIGILVGTILLVGLLSNYESDENKKLVSTQNNSTFEIEKEASSPLSIYYRETENPVTVVESETEAQDTKPIPEPDINTESEQLPTEDGSQIQAVPVENTVEENPSDENTEKPRVFPESINEDARKALVNIVCDASQGSAFDSISGSGITIDPRGVILTNAHVAQYFLFTGDNDDENSVSCTIRTGSPARNTYRARLLYISPTWVKENASQILEDNPLGTGENDFAFLLITDTTNGNPLPEQIPYISFNTNPSLEVGDLLYLAGYPAGFLGGIAISRDLYAVSSFEELAQVYTFGESSIDVIEVSGSLLSQKGASGGSVIDASGNVVGIIVTSTDAEQTEDRRAFAVTLSHINHTLFLESEFGIEFLLSTDLQNTADQFKKEIIPILRQVFLEETN